MPAKEAAAKSITPVFYVFGDAPPGTYYVEGVHLIQGENPIAMRLILDLEPDTRNAEDRRRVEVLFNPGFSSTAGNFTALVLNARKVILRKLPNGRLYIHQVSTVDTDTVRRRWLPATPTPEPE